MSPDPRAHWARSASRVWSWIFLCALLLGCAPTERSEAACRDAFALLFPAVAIENVSESGDSVSVRSQEHQVNCRFGDETPAGPSLLDVTVDGRALSPVHAQLLRWALHLPTPAELLAAPGEARPLGATVAYLIQQLINGLAVGAVLGLVALGYALVYGITGTIQFAYGELYMIGAVLVAGFCLAMPSLAVTIVLAAVVTAAYGWMAERIVWRPIREAGPLPALIAAIGLSLTLREWVRLTQGSGNKWLPPTLPGHWRIWSGGGFEVLVGHAQLLALALAAALAAALGWALKRTRLGRQWRACADDPAAAALVGVDVAGTVSAAFVVGAALAAVAGTVVAVQYGQADFSMGYLMGFKALTAALLGGFGSIPGALLGALVIGLFEATWSAAFGLAWKDAAVFGVLILVLVFRPQGLLRGRAADSAPGLPRRG